MLISVHLFVVEKENVLSHIFLDLFVDFQLLHIGVDEDHFRFDFVWPRPRPEDDLDNGIDDVGVDCEPEAQHENIVDRFDGVIGSDVSVADCGDCAHSPINYVAVLEVPAELDDGRVSCRRIEPAD